MSEKDPVFDVNVTSSDSMVFSINSMNNKNNPLATSEDPFLSRIMIG
jgi:hypothetical protein